MFFYLDVEVKCERLPLTRFDHFQANRAIRKMWFCFLLPERSDSTSLESAAPLPSYGLHTWYVGASARNDFPSTA